MAIPHPSKPGLSPDARQPEESHPGGRCELASSAEGQLARTTGELQGAKEALKQSEDRLAGIIESAMDAIISVDEQQNILLFNPAAEKMFGTSARDVIGKRLEHLIPERFRAAHAQRVRNFGETNQTRRQMSGGMGCLLGLRADGTEFPAEISISQMEARGQKLFTAIVRDISERKRVEDALRENHARLQRVLEVQTVGVLFLDLTTGRLVDANDTFLNLMGYSRSDVEAGELTWQELTPPEHLEVSRAEFRKLAASGRVGPYEKEYFCKDGTRQWLLFAGSSLGGNSCVEFCVDIADRKKAEAALRQSEERLRALVNASSDVVYRMSPDWCEMQQLDGRGFIADTTAPISDWLPVYIDPDDQAMVTQTIQNAIRNKSVFELEHRVRQTDGSLGWTLSRAVPRLDASGEIIEWFGMASNVTARKSAEEALRASERRVRALMESTAEAILGDDLQGNCTFCNPAALRLLGYDDQAELLGKNLHAAVHQSQRDGTPLTSKDCPIGQAVRGGYPFHSDDLVLWRKDGTCFPAECWAHPVLDEASAVGSVLTFLDISERKRTQASLLESEQRLRLFIEYAPAALAMFDRDMRYLHASRRWQADYGLGDRDLKGLCHYDVFPEVSEQWKEVHRRGLAGEVLRSENDRFERADGSMQWIKWEVRPWYETGGGIGGIVIFAEEITERKRAEEELSRKVEDLARSNRDLEQFAYVSSHDLQEPLRMVASYTQLLAERYRGHLDENADKYIAYVVEGTTRMQTLIHDLLAFSRVGRNGRERQNLDLGDVLDEAAENLKASIEESHAVLTRGKLPTVHAERSQMVQLLQNLIGNAIKFRGENAPRISISAECRGRQCVFAVADNGIGIAAEYRERVFEIFQRLHTRAEYPGNGIGLSICKKIIEQHGGRIWVESEPGQGATFKFILPAGQIASKKPKESAHVYATSA